MPLPVALCAVCRECICDHDDYAFAGFAPVTSSSAGLRIGATSPATAGTTPRLDAVAGTFSDHPFAHAASVDRT